MLTIVMIGAGSVGLYIAKMLSKDGHNVILIDNDLSKLQEASRELDVATRHGSGTDWQMLDDLLELAPHLFIALTNNDEVNLVSCSIAKNLGYPRTIARVRDNNYFNKMRLDFARLFEVDLFIGPELLVANEIVKYMMSPGSKLIENFAHGAIQLRTLAIPNKWRKYETKIKELALPQGVIVGLIHRPREHEEDYERPRLIFPHADDRILPDDEVTFIGETGAIADINHFFGLPTKTMRSVAIVGGSLVAVNLARALKNRNIEIKIIEKDYQKCVYLTEILPYCIIIHHDGTDIDFLKSERIDQSELLVACTRRDEVNMLAAVLGKEAGCERCLVILSNHGFSSIADKLGIDHTVAPRVVAAHHILSQIMSGTVTSLVTLYDNQAEIMEVNVSANSNIVGVPLSQLGTLLPKDMLIAMIQNRGRILPAAGTRIISPGDTVILITNPAHVPTLEKIF